MVAHLMGERVVHIVEQCPTCRSQNVRWENESGSITGRDRYLRCMRCGETLRTKLDPMPWLMMVMAACAAIYGWWLVTR